MQLGSPSSKSQKSQPKKAQYNTETTQIIKDLKQYTSISSTTNFNHFQDGLKGILVSQDKSGKLQNQSQNNNINNERSTQDKQQQVKKLAKGGGGFSLLYHNRFFRYQRDRQYNKQNSTASNINMNTSMISVVDRKFSLVNNNTNNTQAHNFSQIIDTDQNLSQKNLAMKISDPINNSKPVQKNENSKAILIQDSQVSKFSPINNQNLKQQNHEYIKPNQKYDQQSPYLIDSQQSAKQRPMSAAVTSFKNQQKRNLFSQKKASDSSHNNTQLRKLSEEEATRNASSSSSRQLLKPMSFAQQDNIDNTPKQKLSNHYPGVKGTRPFTAKNPNNKRVNQAINNLSSGIIIKPQPKDNRKSLLNKSFRALSKNLFFQQQAQKTQLANEFEFYYPPQFFAKQLQIDSQNKRQLKLVNQQRGTSPLINSQLNNFVQGLNSPGKIVAVHIPTTFFAEKEYDRNSDSLQLTQEFRDHNQNNSNVSHRRDRSRGHKSRGGEQLFFAGEFQINEKKDQINQ